MAPCMQCLHLENSGFKTAQCVLAFVLWTWGDVSSSVLLLFGSTDDSGVSVKESVIVIDA